MTATVCWVGEKPLGSKNYLVGAETDDDIPDPGKKNFNLRKGTFAMISFHIMIYLDMSVGYKLYRA